MPGHILNAKCACGFDRELHPGASVTDLYVIAYTADARDLVTIAKREAESADLNLIDDPWLKEKERNPYFIPDFKSAWGPNRCPECKKSSLQIWPRGSWD